MTNEERFIASCESVGETDVRQKLGAGRYSERRAIWATDWLERIESGKSEATKAAESSSRSLQSLSARRHFRRVMFALAGGVLLAGAIFFISLI